MGCNVSDIKLSAKKEKEKRKRKRERERLSFLI